MNFFLFLILTLGFYILIEKYILSDVDNNLNTSAEILKNSIQEKFTPIDFYLGEMSGIIPENLKVKIIDRNGAILYKQNFDNEIHLKEEDLRRVFELKTLFKSNEELRMLIYPYRFFGRLHFLILAEDIEKLKVVRNNILFLFFGIMVVVIFIFMLSSNLVISKILKAVKHINNISQKIEKNNFSYRINEKYNTMEMDELTDTLNKMLDRVEQSFTSIKQFTADVSHELKTPIASIRNMIEVELIATRSQEEYKELLITVLEEINWLTNIINDLLLMTRMDSGKEALNMEKLSLKDILSDVVEIMMYIAEEQKIDLHLQDFEDVYLLGDKSKLKRVILNLISNAIKYNKINGKVILSVTERNDEVSILFSDTGIGIKKENLEKIFERFYRENEVRTTKKSGTGLGLAIVQFIVKLHDGNVSIHSEAGVGTDIEVTLKKLSKEIS